MCISVSYGRDIILCIHMLNYRNVGTIWNQFLPKDTGYILLQNHRTDIHYTSASFQWCDSTIETHEINQTFLLDTNHNAVNSNEKTDADRCANTIHFSQCHSGFGSAELVRVVTLTTHTWPPEVKYLCSNLWVCTVATLTCGYRVQYLIELKSA